MMTNELNNLQFILIAEVKIDIGRLKQEGKSYSEIRLAIIDKYETHWLLTDKAQREQAIGAALYAYGMGDEERQQAQELKDLIGHMIV